ncbi:hypothetical protein [Algoriphagus confluentis]|uniref:Uncharacterized protein n=1 Tax=Algoriphagus confluentis TaxID=1697556 RepID=A0ABQ6PPK0_9BACT|nr:hypothetical protein Aconfl_24800 [Algoriphagus confluentis]
MGFIPLFLTMGGALLLFFLTVKTTMQRKLNLQTDLLDRLAEAHPDLGLEKNQIPEPSLIMEKWKKAGSDQKISDSSLRLIRELKVNRHQYNQLIKKAPYNWVAKLSGFRPI